MHISSENPLENDDGRDVPAWADPPSLRRALVFLLLGPILGVLVALSPDVASGGLNAWLVLIGKQVFVIALLVSAITGLVDGILSRTLSIFLRAPLAALVGAVAAVGLPAALLGPLPQEMSMALAIGGAFCMGVCSVLSHEYGRTNT
ncbi:hypothetical protein JQ629_05350 [Bradyrhizobium sp. AUGA SZCCT0222]|uniref:hypothetical protein n=1 Tax=Bradyrhizobium sp. AUGA SZCCT0222 TaxID=2807668 RepID=UPI001BAC2B5D|nr:hypothetical protein [Bradyrhizobium sp. AUGA SZCCT0222]MBR1266932.1 hypothetical protein [Bradyrhizobium sp. AUGA SZCCT0222]